MKVKKLICLSLPLLMVLSSAGCEDGGLTTPSAPAEKSSDTDTSAEKKTDSVSAEDISVTWQDSRVYTDLTLGRYTEITTYGVKGYEDVPFIKLSDYAGILFGGTEPVLSSGRDTGDGFVSDEKDIQLDFNMMPTILDRNNVPWFDPAGITDAVHQYQNGATEVIYNGKNQEERVTEYLNGLFDKIAENMPKETSTLTEDSKKGDDITHLLFI